MAIGIFYFYIFFLAIGSYVFILDTIVYVLDFNLFHHMQGVLVGILIIWIRSSHSELFWQLYFYFMFIWY